MAKHGRTQLRALTFATLAAGAVLAVPTSAHAETVSPTAKGTVGGALLGGELVCFGEALFGVRSPAAYLIGAGVGAVGGGVGGYFIEQAVDDGRIPAYMLAGGLALIVPAIVITLDATRYLPTEGAREDKPVTLPPSDPGKPGGSSVVGAEPSPAPAPASPAPSGTSPAPDGTSPAPATPPSSGGGGGGGTQNRHLAPLSLFNLGDGTFTMGLPVPEVRPLIGSVERARMGVDNRGSELRFPVMHVSF